MWRALCEQCSAHAKHPFLLPHMRYWSIQRHQHIYADNFHRVVITSDAPWLIISMLMKLLPNAEKNLPAIPYECFKPFPIKLRITISSWTSTTPNDCNLTMAERRSLCDSSTASWSRFPNMVVKLYGEWTANETCVSFNLEISSATWLLTWGWTSDVNRQLTQRDRPRVHAAAESYISAPKTRATKPCDGNAHWRL